MKTPTIGITAVLLLCAGCDSASLAPETKEPARHNETANTPPEVLAEPSEIPEGLGDLKLTKDQAAKINQWLEEQGELVDPSKAADYVKSVLRDDQHAAFQKVIESGGR